LLKTEKKDLPFYVSNVADISHQKVCAISVSKTEKTNKMARKATIVGKFTLAKEGTEPDMTDSELKKDSLTYMRLEYLKETRNAYNKVKMLKHSIEMYFWNNGFHHNSNEGLGKSLSDSMDMIRKLKDLLDEETDRIIQFTMEVK